ncbi:phage portal protein [Paraburkholderia pallida]|uniref:Phage portal protein n=1 Tax=Paraburkholderia pallida TaxID=2547399 RepID=A0A4P7D195_9BURK|nr:phage portal protein [Paraburkholderia pallida]QBR00490.1 phage portal protein [Paraburkholderia pallida]
MSAHAYIQYDDVPEALLETALRHRDTLTGARLIAFDNSLFSGEIVDASDGRAQIEFAWPRDVELRHALADWLTYQSISFTVVM